MALFQVQDQPKCTLLRLGELGVLSFTVKVLAKNKPAGINKHFSMAIAMEELVSMLGDESKVARWIPPGVIIGFVRGDE